MLNEANRAEAGGARSSHQASCLTMLLNRYVKARSTENVRTESGRMWIRNDVLVPHSLASASVQKSGQ